MLLQSIFYVSRKNLLNIMLCFTNENEKHIYVTSCNEKENSCWQGCSTNRDTRTGTPPPKHPGPWWNFRHMNNVYAICFDVFNVCVSYLFDMFSVCVAYLCDIYVICFDMFNVYVSYLCDMF